MTNVFDLSREDYIAQIRAKLDTLQQYTCFEGQPDNTQPVPNTRRILAKDAVFYRMPNAPWDLLIDDPCLPVQTRANTALVLRSFLAPSTLPTYGTGIRNFVRWCQRINLDERLIFPTPAHILTSYACMLAGSVAKSTAQNYLSGIRAWHLVQGADWNTSPRLEMALKAVGVLAPEGKPPRLPITREMLEILTEHLDPSRPDHACAIGLACVALWSQSRLGELTSSNAHSFDNKRVFRRTHLGTKISSRGSILLNYPWTKTKGFVGEQAILNRQKGPTDPIAALKQHLTINDVPKNLPLFSYHVPAGWQCMTKTKLLQICNAVWSVHGIPRITGHSFRIGGTTELLKAGVNPAIVQVMGRWSSDAFLQYWRHLDIIIPFHAENLPEITQGFFGKLQNTKSSDGKRQKIARKAKDTKNTFLGARNKTVSRKSLSSASYSARKGL